MRELDNLLENRYEPLPRTFFEPSARVVARALLGHVLIRRTPDGPCGGVIVETEAYLENDAACHAAPGLTKRNRVMFGPPGFAYVYFIYGCHFCVNAVCRPAGTAEAVLIRAIEPTMGIPGMQRRRAQSRGRRSKAETTAGSGKRHGTDQRNQLTNGPARLCEALGIDGAMDGVDLCSSNSCLLIARNPCLDQSLAEWGPVVVTPRIGITKAASLELRFYLQKSPFVSRRHKEALS